MKITKAGIAEKAVELFRSEGYEKVSVDMICKACNVTKGSFYHHFKSKYEVLQSFLTSSLSRHATLMADLLEENNPREQLLIAYSDFFQYPLILGPDLI